MTPKRQYVLDTVIENGKAEVSHLYIQLTVKRAFPALGWLVAEGYLTMRSEVIGRGGPQWDIHLAYYTPTDKGRAAAMGTGPKGI